MARTRLKVCGITSVADAELAVKAGVDAIGLVFYGPSPRAVNIQQAAEISQRIPPFVTTVALFVDAEADEIWQCLSHVSIDMLQFHGAETARFCEQFKRPYMKAIRMKSTVDLESAFVEYRSARGLLLDAYQKGVPGGTGERFDWQRIPSTRSMPIVLAGGLNANNIGEAIETVAPDGVDVSGGVEASPGIKDQGRINALVEQLNKADSTRV